MTNIWKESIFIEQLLYPNMVKLGHVQHQQHQGTSGMKKNAVTQGRETVA